MLLKNALPVGVTQTVFVLVAHFLLHSQQLTAFGAITAIVAFGLSAGWWLYGKEREEVSR